MAAYVSNRGDKMKARHYPASPPSDAYLFGTCVIDLFMPQAGLDAVRLLEREGVTVHYPRGQSCCGQPAYSSGNPEQSRDVARSQMALFPKDWPVIVPSGSCAGMMRHHWPELFKDDAALLAQARQLSREPHPADPRPLWRPEPHGVLADHTVDRKPRSERGPPGWPTAADPSCAR
eukprot:gene31507-53824_t